MSGEVEADLADSYRISRNSVECAVNLDLENTLFSEKFEKWAVIPVILSDTFISGFPEIVKLSSKGKVLEFRLQVAYTEFKKASSERRLAMIFDALSRSVDLMPKLKVSPESQEKFRAALVTARSALLPK
jgi:hypothetical protein